MAIANRKVIVKCKIEDSIFSGEVLVIVGDKQALCPRNVVCDSEHVYATLVNMDAEKNYALISIDYALGGTIHIPVNISDIKVQYQSWLPLQSIIDEYQLKNEKTHHDSRS